MPRFAERSALAPQGRVLFIAATITFAYTVAIGILNGLDVWEPEHDVLMSHVHSGTLGWITLSVASVAVLLFSRDRDATDAEQRRMTLLTWALVAGVELYVLAFLAGDSIFDDRAQRPVVGTILFVPVIGFLVWLIGAYRGSPRRAAHLGLLLAWISLLVGAVFGVILGIYTAGGEVPGLGAETAARFADAHPPAMVIGYLLVAGFAIVEWLLHPDDTGRLPLVQIWLLFAAGLLINVAFVTGTDEQLAGPANLLMIAAGVLMLWRSRRLLAPAGWRGPLTGFFPRISLIFLVAYLALLTRLVAWIVSDTIDFDVLTPSQEGLLLAFDHTMFIGVMTNVVFGVLALHLVSERVALANKVLLVGVNIGIVGFALGLLTTTTALKRVFAPIMGVALLVGLGLYLVTLLSAERTRHA